MTILLLTSCKNSEKTETENNSEPKIEITQTEFKKIETNNSLELEFQLLDENGNSIKVSVTKKENAVKIGFRYQ